jgi:hypothetical protein
MFSMHNYKVVLVDDQGSTITASYFCESAKRAEFFAADDYRVGGYTPVDSTKEVKA